MTDDGEGEMNIRTPRFRFELNLNTIVVIVGFASGFVAWGYTLADIQSGRIENKQKIDDISARVSTNEMALRRIDLQDLRITNVEKAAADATSTMRSLETTLNGLASDVKVTKEILQRIEAAQKAKYSP